METPFLNLINYASLVATNSARHRFVAGKSKLLLEFGLRRAQVVAVFVFIYMVQQICMSYLFSAVISSLVGARWWNRGFQV